MRTNFVIQESKNVKNVTNRIAKVLDAKYEKTNLKDVTFKTRRFQIRLIFRFKYGVLSYQIMPFLNNTMYNSISLGKIWVSETPNGSM